MVLRAATLIRTVADWFSDVLYCSPALLLKPTLLLCLEGEMALLGITQNMHIRFLFLKKEVKIAIATLSQSTGWGAACGS